MKRTARHLMVIFGTRPEAIKLGSVINELRSRPGEFRVTVCVTAQHRDMLDQVLAAFRIHPDYDLNVMGHGQTLHQSSARILSALEPVLRAEAPDWVLVQGDTNTTLAGALAAFYSRIPVGHVEAGLRTGDPGHPFPEEVNRTLVTRLAAMHFAPTLWAAENLLAEGVSPFNILVTGNTGVDSLLHVARGLEQGRLSAPNPFPTETGRKLVLVTAHRRENLGVGMDSICEAVLKLTRRDDVVIAWPLHLNPGVQQPVRRRLEGHANIRLLDPLDYVPFVDLMRRSHFILTDSGGIQEEAPSLGKPVLVMREKTERPEAIEAGTARLVGTDPRRIVEEATRLLSEPAAYAEMARAHNPFGDGNACRLIADSLARRPTFPAEPRERAELGGSREGHVSAPRN